MRRWHFGWKSLGWFLLLSMVATGCKNKPKPPPLPPEVHVLTVEPRDVPIYKEWIGSLEGFVNAEIRAQVTGYLLNQNYVEGSKVKKGELLFQIDPRPFQAALDQAQGKLAQDEAQVSRTRWDVERYAPLAKQKAISQQEYNDAVQANLAAQAQVKAVQAAVEAANVNLGFTRITSPIEGIAGVAQAQIGDLVGPGGPLLTIVSTLDPMKVFFPVSEQSYLAYRRQYTNDTERAAHEKEIELQLILADGSTYRNPGSSILPGARLIQLTDPNVDQMLESGCVGAEGSLFPRQKATSATANNSCAG
jgi:membrane fusion protein (multidrug efflux system)